ncbi:MAG: potassium channel family protein [Polyangiales bacterium]
MEAPTRRIAIAFSALALLVTAGSVGYFALGHGRWHLSDCVYMTVITLSTVGFGELNEMGRVPGARALTVGLIVGGVGTLAYVQGTVTALFVEGALGQAFRRNRMRKAIGAMSGHIVVAGAGSTGRHVIEELVMTKTPFVVIDRDHAHLQRISDDLAKGEMLFVHGDATEDSALIEAGVERARGVVAALTHDKDNLFVTLSARSLNTSARIVAKVAEVGAGPKMLKAGATSVVNPTMIGGRQIASQCLRPEVNELLEQLRGGDESGLRLEEIAIPAHSTFIGKPLKDAPIRRDTRALVVAARDASRAMTFNPEPEYVIREGMILIVMADAAGIAKLRALVTASAT